MAKNPSEPVTPAEIEAEIMRFVKLLDQATELTAKRGRAAAQAKVAYKVAHAGVRLKASGTVAERDDQATLACETELETFEMAEAVLDAAKEAGRNIRSQLDALRSINANVRKEIEFA